ncbi:MAG: cytochrome P450, partial [Pseudomonadota bacterium]
MSEATAPRMIDQDPATIALADIDVSQRELWAENRKFEFLARLRNEAPVHFCPESETGPYWSVTRYADIMEVENNWQVFSSDPAITIENPEEDFELPMFIAMDEPRHSEQRKTVQPAVAPNMLKEFEPLIRSRTQEILDKVPVGEPFDWVDTVSIELTTMMLATLFDFPFEDRRKLTRWSDVTTNRENPDICPGGEEQWKQELLECLTAFMGMYEERKRIPLKNDLISLLAHGEK